jgi:hypothetical protein
MAPDNGNSQRCLAGKCAVWREIPYDAAQPTMRFIECPDRKALKEPVLRPPHVDPTWEFAPYDADEGDPARWVEPDDEYQLRRYGRCGLAPVPKRR